MRAGLLRNFSSRLRNLYWPLRLGRDRGADRKFFRTKAWKTNLEVLATAVLCHGSGRPFRKCGTKGRAAFER
jgi:hypothetical protein